jgi:prepilin-type processing-associated H-X9-DG protein
MMNVRQRNDGRSSRAKRERAARAFTQIELLLSIGVIAVLIGIVLPALGRAREAGRGASCAASLHHAAVAMTCYLDEHDGAFWSYFQDVPGAGGGRRWWFGFEKGGPATNPSAKNRPLDKANGFLGRYMSSSAADFLCPAFPYDAAAYTRKFSPPAGGYGYNTGALGGFNSLDLSQNRTRRIQEFTGRTSDVFALADGLHFDRLDYSGANPLSQPFNEPAYLQWQDPAKFSSNVGVNGGFGHFRHVRRANVLYLDGHVSSQTPIRSLHPYSGRGLGLIANLADEQGRTKTFVRGSATYAIDVVYGL